MKIKIIDNCGPDHVQYIADCIELPDSRPIGIGFDETEAIFDLMIALMSSSINWLQYVENFTLEIIREYENENCIS